jgi:hypothetical protein
VVLRPGNLLEMSSHFIPLPLSLMSRAESSAGHVPSLFAGDSAGWGGILRFPPAPLPAAAEGGGCCRSSVAGMEDDLV